MPTQHSPVNSPGFNNTRRRINSDSSLSTPACSRTSIISPINFSPNVVNTPPPLPPRNLVTGSPFNQRVSTTSSLTSTQSHQINMSLVTTASPSSGMNTSTTFSATNSNMQGNLPSSICYAFPKNIKIPTFQELEGESWFENFEAHVKCFSCNAVEKYETLLKALPDSYVALIGNNLNHNQPADSKYAEAKAIIIKRLKEINPDNLDIFESLKKRDDVSFVDFLKTIKRIAKSENLGENQIKKKFRSALTGSALGHGELLICQHNNLEKVAEILDAIYKREIQQQINVISEQLNPRQSQDNRMRDLENKMDLLFKKVTDGLADLRVSSVNNYQSYRNRSAERQQSRNFDSNVYRNRSNERQRVSSDFNSGNYPHRSGDRPQRPSTPIHANRNRSNERHYNNMPQNDNNNYRNRSQDRNYSQNTRENPNNYRVSDREFRPTRYDNDSNWRRNNDRHYASANQNNDWRHKNNYDQRSDLNYNSWNDNNKPRLTGANAIERKVSFQNENGNICYYHSNFGKKAIKCEEFCRYYNDYNSKNRPSVSQH